MKPKVYQTKSQTAILGCMAASNPESNINWFKATPKMADTRGKRSNASLLAELVANISSSESDYVLVDASNSRYQIHKHKQANQIVSYFKIKVIFA
jgi:hypothetical protein